MKALLTAVKLFLFFTVLTGIIYPIFVTAVAQVTFSKKANGSILVKDKKKIGSELIGQQFDSAIYFRSRPSAVSYNPLPSGGSNYGLTSLKMKNLVLERRRQFILLNQLDSVTEIPSEMLFASGSGLDPHISKKSALLQVDRISGARNFNSDQKQKLFSSINELTESPQFLCLGEERINVLLLNLEIDKIR